ELLAKHPTESVSVAASPDDSWIAGCSPTLASLTILHRVNTRWQLRPMYQMQGGAGCGGLVFYKPRSPAVARTDGTITTIDLGRDIEAWRVSLRADGQTMFWQAPAERRLGNQGDAADGIQASPDGRWLLTFDRNAVVRLSSPYDYTTVALP